MPLIFMDKRGMCRLPDGTKVKGHDAELMGFDVVDAADLATMELKGTKRAAAPVPAPAHNGMLALEVAPGLYATPEGARLSELDATKAGFRTVTRRELAAFEGFSLKDASAAKDAPAPAAKAADLTPYAEAIIGLPEAATRPRAALKLVQSNDAETMPADKAARLLRSLPEETAETLAMGDPNKLKLAAPKPLSNKEAYAIRRKMELAASGLAIKAGKGDAKAKQDCTAINYALKLTSTGTSLESACNIAGVNLSTFR